MSTWLVAGPWAIPAIHTRPFLAAAFHQALDAPVPGISDADTAVVPGVDHGGITWRTVASPSADVNLASGATGRSHSARTVFAGVSLTVAAEGDRYLFLGTDDAVRVLLDGRELARIERARAPREDDDAIPLYLTVGRHALLLRLVTRGDTDLLARITDRAFRPDPAVVVELPGVTDAVCTALADRAAVVTATRRVVPEGTRVDLRIAYPGGTARTDAEAQRTVTVTAASRPPVTLSIPLTGPAANASTLSVSVPPDGANTVAVSVTGTGRTFAVRVSSAVRAALLRAAEVLPMLDPAWGVTEPTRLPAPPPRATLALPAEAIWSVEGTAQRLAALVADGDSDAGELSEQAGLLGSLLVAVAAGRDPYVGRHGPMRRAYRSSLDGSLQSYSVYVPPAYHGDRPFPLIVGLHGLHGGANRMLPVLLGLYDETESREHAERHLPPLPDADAILVAPYGYGDAGYRAQGEVDVLRVLDEVRRAYRIDPDRTYITGLSMGGIGAAGIPLHHPWVFAAAAPLCGYHSYFVRGDTRGVRRPWETYLMESRSNADWAENGLGLPMYIVQGTHDLPLSNSQVLIDRYTALHYPLEFEWPPLGHNVWGQTYAHGRIVPYFLRFHRDPAPRHVRFRTADLRDNTSAWVTLNAVAIQGQWSDIDITLDRHGVAQGQTHNLVALTLAPPRAAIDPGTPTVQLTLDGDAVNVPVGAASHLLRRSGHWAVVTTPPPVQFPHGPIREVYDAPLLFVFGTADPAQTALNERVAQWWAHRPGVRVSYPVVGDDAYTSAMGQGRTLVLVGTARSNRVLASVADRLPLRIDGDAVHIGERTLRSAHTGAVFATANPDHPAQTLLVVTGVDALGTWRSRSLPDLVPDYVVFDDRVAPARGREILGSHATVLAAGFWNSDGRPSGDDRDPITPTSADDGD